MNDPKRPVSLEDLLRLKRVERPPAEFWNDFDRQLRAKQLAALVEKRPWWHGLQRSFLRVGRYHVGFGTAAVVAFVFLSNRDRLFPASAPVGDAVAARRTAMPAVDAQVASAMREVQPLPMAAVAEQAEADEPVTSSTQPASVGRGVLVAELPQSLGAVSPVAAISGAAIDRTPEPSTPSARFIAANFAAAQADEPASGTLLAGSSGFEARVLPARAALVVDPIQHMAPPGEPRRATRFLTAMVSTSMDEASVRTSERMASRISQDELYDQVRRFGARRGGFNMKF